MGRLVGLVATVALVLAGASQAMATTRYAVPGGDTSDPNCLSKAANCSGQHALDVAQVDDEIIFATGTYDTGSTGLVQNNHVPQNIHGEDGQPPPWILVNDPHNFAFSSCFCEQSGEIRHMNFENHGGGGALFVVGGADQVNNPPMLIYDVYALSNGTLGLVPFFHAFTLITVQAFALGRQAIAVDSFADLNVQAMDAVAPFFDAVALQQNPECFFGQCRPGATTAFVFNGLLEGGPQGADWRTTSASCGPNCLAYGLVVFHYSSFRNGSNCSACPPPQGDHNQSAPPLLVDPNGGDLHQAPGSPTIDAGAELPGRVTTDIDGDPRKVGSAPDIGADEFVPNQAAPRTRPPVALRPAAVAVAPQELIDRQAFPRLRFLFATLQAIRNRSLVVPLPCQSLITGKCVGTIAFVTASRVVVPRKATAEARKRKLKIGEASFSIPNVATRNVKVNLSRAARRLLAAKGSSRAVARVTVKANGVTRTTTQDVTIKGKRQRR